MAASTLKDDQTQAIALRMNDNNPSAEHPAPPDSAPSPPPLDLLRQQIDWEQLHRLSDDSSEFEWELLQVFTADSCVYLAQLKQAIARQDYWRIEQDAHHIRGASANIGAVSMQTAAAALEQQARAQQLEDCDRWIHTLETALDELQLLVKLAAH